MARITRRLFKSGHRPCPTCDTGKPIEYGHTCKTCGWHVAEVPRSERPHYDDNLNRLPAIVHTAERIVHDEHQRITFGRAKVSIAAENGDWIPLGYTIGPVVIRSA